MATQAAAEAGDRECPICGGPFTRPKVLACGHVFCACLVPQPAVVQVVAGGRDGAGQASLTFRGWVDRRLEVSADGRTVQCRGGGLSCAVSSLPMQDDVLYEVRVDSVVSGYTVLLGVVAQDPATLGETFIPSQLATALEVQPYGVYDFATWRSEDRPYLRNVAAGSRFGLAVRAGRVHLYVDGQDRGVVRSDTHPVTPRPCFFFIAVDWELRKVTGQPLRSL